MWCLRVNSEPFSQGLLCLRSSEGSGMREMRREDEEETVCLQTNAVVQQLVRLRTQVKNGLSYCGSQHH